MEVHGQVLSPLRRDARTRLTKQAIAAAALKVFSERGYVEAGIREIAQRAEVNPALVTRYFRSKLNLFEHVLEAHLDASLFVEVDRDGFGERLAALFCGRLAHEASVIPMLVLSAGDSQARNAALEILKRRVIEPLQDWFGGADAAERSAQLLAVVTGFYTYRLMLPLDPLAMQPTASMQHWLARTLQEIVDR